MTDGAATLPRIDALAAPAAWQRIDFLSDLHLHASEPATFEAWREYMARTSADAVFILGDLFEAWVGDDSAIGPEADAFEASCREVLAATAERASVFFMHGNRDFLLGESFARHAGFTLLHDPTALEFAGARFVLTHGDMLCLDDTAYMAFRAQVRSEAWMQGVLAKPLAERRALARHLRSESESAQRGATTYADADAAMSARWLAAAGADTMIHGHTHRPAEHTLPGGARRVVLSDWDLAATPPRAQVLRLERDAAGTPRLTRLAPTDA